MSRSSRSPDLAASALVRRAREGDTDAFAELVRLHHAAVYGVVRRMVEDAESAEELVQDTFVRAHRGLAEFRGDSRFSTWIHRIALRLCLDYLASRRHKTRRRESSLDGMAEEGHEPADRGPGPDEIREIHEMDRLLRSGLADLGADHRAALLLRHQEGMGYEEIAEVLGISVSNAKVRVHRARESLLRGLRERGFPV